ncbi:MAG: hypothetical protein M1837_002847 [Sclerophora amabilis]|nr:MAG: hypothetical protein M1837_002847 [Sclerophora amabilis]
MSSLACKDHLVDRAVPRSNANQIVGRGWVTETSRGQRIGNLSLVKLRRSNVCETSQGVTQIGQDWLDAGAAYPEWKSTIRGGASQERAPKQKRGARQQTGAKENNESERVRRWKGSSSTRRDDAMRSEIAAVTSPSRSWLGWRLPSFNDKEVSNRE